MGLMLPHSAQITLVGYIRNLSFVTAGNIIGGAVLIAGLYWYASSGEKELKSSKSAA